MSEQSRISGTQHVPLECYEELRSSALGVTTAAPSNRGLALLMRNGMAAWIRAWASCANPPPPEDIQQAQRPIVRPEVVAVLAEMAMAAAREVTV